MKDAWASRKKRGGGFKGENGILPEMWDKEPFRHGILLEMRSEIEA